MSMNQSNGLGITREYKQVEYPQPDFTLKVNVPTKPNWYEITQHKKIGCNKNVGEHFCGYLMVYKKPMVRLLCNECKKKYKGKKVTPDLDTLEPRATYELIVTGLDGIETSYPSIRAVCRKYGNIGMTSIRNWVKKGYIPSTGEKIRRGKMMTSQKKKIQVGELIFESRNDAARHYEVTGSTIQNWIRYGFNPEGLPVKSLNN